MPESSYWDCLLCGEKHRLDQKKCTNLYDCEVCGTRRKGNGNLTKKCINCHRAAVTKLKSEPEVKINPGVIVPGAVVSLRSQSPEMTVISASEKTVLVYFWTGTKITEKWIPRVALKVVSNA